MAMPMRRKLKLPSFLLPQQSLPCSSSATSEPYLGPVVPLRNLRNGAQIFLIGTCHALPESAEEVRKVIRAVQPDVVAVELCEARAKNLMAGTNHVPNMDFLNLPPIANLKNVIAELLGVSGLSYGEEFKVAISEARLRGAKVRYIDADLDVTLGKLKIPSLLNDVLTFIRVAPTILAKNPLMLEALSTGSLPDLYRAMLKTQALKDSVEFFRTSFPAASKVILDERNELMVKRLRELEGNVVGVVGASHVHGMSDLWHKEE